MLTERQLTGYANKFLMENYNMRLSVPLTINGRLTRTLGRFVWNARTKKPVGVEMNKNFTQYNDVETVLNVLQHELVHYALFMQGKPHRDGQRCFENELKSMNIVSQSTIDQYQIASKKQIYMCASCNKKFTLGRRLRGNGKYHTCNCGGKLIDKGKRVVVR